MGIELKKQGIVEILAAPSEWQSREKSARFEEKRLSRNGKQDRVSKKKERESDYEKKTRDLSRKRARLDE